MWLELLENLQSKVELRPAVSPSAVHEAERLLSIDLPEHLKELLSQTNGVMLEYGVQLLWPVEQIVVTNLRFRNADEFRNLYMSFDCLLFFGEAGNGSQFGYAVDADGSIRRDDIFAWGHENDSRVWVAPTLGSFIEWWCKGEIQV